jgi:hypothetical protein
MTKHYMKHSEKGKRTCNRCLLKKDMTEFYANTHYECKPCFLQRSKRYGDANYKRLRPIRDEWMKNNRKACVKYSTDWRERNYDKVMNAHLMRTYNVSYATFKIILETQNNTCPICKSILDRNNKGKRPCLDHNHTTNKVRGILCSECNCAIGLFKESISILRNASDYLREHQ